LAPTSREFLESDPGAAHAEFHLHPHYRAQRPVDGTLLKTKAGLDDFVTEKYHDQIAARLAEWSSSLLRSPQSVQALETLLGPEFSGSSLRPVESRLLRSGAALEARKIEFSQQSTLSVGAFLQEMRGFIAAFSKLTAAEFQITSIEATGADTASAASSASNLPVRLHTRVRYELVGTGADFHREQRVGNWELEWYASPSGEFRIRGWRATGETRSRSFAPIFADITAQALGSNASYSGQLLRGVDYWRTVLDGACGIDIYGHNGISVADIDNDGLDDLYICQPAGLPNRLYRNRGDGTFEDITESSGLGVLENTACALFADFDNDGRQDVIVVRAGGPLLFLNQGGGTFRRQPDAFHFAHPPQGTFTGAAAADYDRDGWLDIYFCLYVYYQGTDQYKYPVPYYAAENGPPNFMMRNNRDGTFRDVTAESGLNKNNTRYSFCCAWNDYDGDGWPDLYVVNDFGRKNLYHNQGDGTFSDVAAEAGVEDVGAGMSVCWFDHDNDGADDLYVADMWSAAGERVSAQDIFKSDAPKQVRGLYRKHAMGNSLFRNAGLRSAGSAGAFQDRTISAGVGMGRWSWSSDTWDFDHDGFLDLYIANGMISGSSREDLNSFFWRQVVANSPDLASLSPDYEQGWSAINELIRSDHSWSGYERNVFYANNRDGTFSNVSGAVDLDFLEDSRAFVLADFDHDGRQELFLKNRNAPQLRILKNVMQQLPPAISFRLQGTKSNRDAIGAVVTIETATSRQTRNLQAGSGFLSQSSKDLFFGLGDAKDLVQASIRWPSGLVQELHDLPSGHRIWVAEGSAALRAEPFKPQTPHSQPPTIAPQPAEPLPTSVQTWLLAPVSAPDFSLPDSSGQTCTLAALRGKPVLLNFWTARSASCQDDLNTFNRMNAHWASQGLQLLTVNVDEATVADSVQTPPGARSLSVAHYSFPILRGSEDVPAIYNILYRYLFDRHRDLSLPTSFLLNEQSEIVKVYQGPINSDHVEQVEQDFRKIPHTTAERLAKALPWPGVSETFEFARNYLSYGSIFFQRGYFEQAESFFRQALRDDPASAEAYYGVGSACLNLQKTAEARASFQRATELEPSYPDTVPNAWNNLGLLATREGRTEEAIGYFQQALKVNPDHLVALENLGNAYRQLKNWGQAREVLERAVAVSPADPESNYSLGMVFAQTNDTQRAYDFLQRALKARPVYPEALNNLGVLYLRTQRRDEAVAVFEECIRVAPAFDQSYLNLSRVYAVEGAPDKARAVLLDLLKQHPDHAQAQKELQQLPR
jgi:tetratricopeptide (TPR) repeat protein/peroxiredoxin